MSWVLQKGPYHTVCSPIAEDAAYRQAVLIPLDITAPSLEEAPHSAAKIPMIKRLLIVISGLWLLLMLVFALNSGNGKFIDSFSIFSVFGLTPAGLAWGIAWIKGAKRNT